MISHGSFTLEKIYQATPERVYRAWSDPEVRSRWFVGPEGWQQQERRLDLREGGDEVLAGILPNGRQSRYQARYHHVVPGERVGYTYEMWVNGVYHSLSVVTVEMDAHPEGTRLVLTEQTAWFDGTLGEDGARARQGGIGFHLNNLAREITADPAVPGAR